MPLHEVKALVTAGAAREMAQVGVEKYDVVISHPSLPTHANWTSRIFAADGDRLYIVPTRSRLNAHPPRSHLHPIPTSSAMLPGAQMDKDTSQHFLFNQVVDVQSDLAARKEICWPVQAELNKVRNDVEAQEECI
ncbi:hypothetical protein HYPSUDRAFT_202599 [Hypholoma sublateritium FD-334 SS-4]|uniref:Uncharacterized protein n=1 Tax=Hypholoma sublateritium (strain FD-334 SS-4) TaxID=945553 RepID=A0A0D2MEA3_HYPSF|nr:hypothetical protein HYPSUDRAFT_202599 [Hypholoma sublateritium FD-334 SS-4]